MNASSETIGKADDHNHKDVDNISATKQEHPKTPESKGKGRDESAKTDEKANKNTKPISEDEDKKSKKDDKVEKTEAGKSLQTAKSSSYAESLIKSVNSALLDEYKTNEIEFEKFANENGLKKNTLDTILKLVKHKLINKLVEERVRIRDLTWIVLYKLFLKHGEKDKKYRGTRTLHLEKKYPKFLKELGVIMAPFDDLHPNINRDIQKMKEFDGDSNLSDDQFYFASYLRNIQQ
jgi:hypothetical protein